MIYRTGGAGAGGAGMELPARWEELSTARKGQQWPLHQPRHAELSLQRVVVLSARQDGCHQTPECPHLSEFPCVPGGGLVILHRLTAVVDAGLYPA